MSDNPTPCGTEAGKDAVQRRRPRVHPDDVQLALRLRAVQWLCDSLAHSVPGREADPDELAKLMAALPILQADLRDYAARSVKHIGPAEDR